MQRVPDNRPPYHELGLELERARREAGLKARELAEQLFVSPRTIRRYLNGERLPTIELTQAWERACNIEAGRLDRLHPDAARNRPYLVADGDAPAAAARPDGAARTTGAGHPGGRRRWAVMIALAAVVVGAAARGLTLLGGEPKSEFEQTVERATRLSTTYTQRTGSSARTWSDFTIAGGEPGPPINGRRTVQVRCRIRGFEVSSGNQWWYLVASAPWRGKYFATADAFYNQRRTDGVDFRETRFVDPRVPLCP